MARPEQVRRSTGSSSVNLPVILEKLPNKWEQSHRHHHHHHGPGQKKTTLLPGGTGWMTTQDDMTR